MHDLTLSWHTISVTFLVYCKCYDFHECYLLIIPLYAIDIIGIMPANIREEFSKTKSSTKSRLVTTRGRIIGLRGTGKTVQEIQDTVGCVKSTVQK